MKEKRERSTNLGAVCSIEQTCEHNDHMALAFSLPPYCDEHPFSSRSRSRSISCSSNSSSSGSCSSLVVLVGLLTVAVVTVVVVVVVVAW